MIPRGDVLATLATLTMLFIVGVMLVFMP